MEHGYTSSNGEKLIILGTEGELHRCSNIIGDAMEGSIYACKLVENYIC